MASTLGTSFSSHVETVMNSRKIDQNEKRRKCCKLLQVKAPRVISMAKNLLDLFVRTENSVNLQRDPLAHFVQEEIILHSQDVTQRIKKQIITYLDFRDAVENLVGIHTFCITKDPEIAAQFGRLLRKFVGITAELAAALEQVAEVPVTDWNAIGMTILEKVERLGLVAHPHFGYFIPQMKDFRSLKLLGAGGFGAVYLCVYKPVLFTCTVKLVSLDCFTRYKMACMDKVVASVIRNPFLVKYYACFQCKEAYLTIMEYIPGLDLMRVVSRDIFLNETAVLFITAQLILALEHMHLRGFLHRDVKVSNMLILNGGRVKVIDFDTTKISQAHFSKRVLRTYFRRTAYEYNDGETAGTLPYMAPEILSGKAYGRSVDWWSSGITIYKMATGRVPFRAKSKQMLRERICNTPLKWPKTPEHPHSANLNTKDYTYRLLKKNSQERLGSRSYAELRIHPYFEKFNWKFLYDSRELFNLASISIMLGEDATKTRITEPDDDRVFMEVNQMTDVPADFQKRILCMSSTSWKKLLMLIRENVRYDEFGEVEEGCVPIDEGFMDTEEQKTSGIHYNTAPLLLNYVKVHASDIAKRNIAANQAKKCSIA